MALRQKLHGQPRSMELENCRISGRRAGSRKVPFSQLTKRVLKCLETEVIRKEEIDYQ